jgi:hypothetical protein
VCAVKKLSMVKVKGRDEEQDVVNTIITGSMESGILYICVKSESFVCNLCQICETDKLSCEIL